MANDFEVIVDGNDQKLEIGDRVKIHGFIPGEDDPKIHFGTITEISDMDGDVDDYGRPIPIYPEVTVKFDNDSMGDFLTHDTRQYEDDNMEFKCDELDKEPNG